MMVEIRQNLDGKYVIWVTDQFGERSLVYFSDYQTALCYKNHLHSRGYA